MTALGIPREYLNPRKHCPCPSCGGRDRFRFTDWQGNGGFICNQCTPEGGSGFDLIMLVTGCDFQAALQSVAEVLGMTAGHPRLEVRTPANTPKTPPECDKDNLAILSSIWHESHPVSVKTTLAAYLSRRGLDFAAALTHSPDLRLNPALSYWHDGQIIGQFPAMIGRFTDAGGQLQGLHITYLQPNGSGKAALTDRHGEALAAKKMRSRQQGSLKGCAIRLFPHQTSLAVCEGIETALAARELFNLPAWACGSAWGIRHFAIPPDVKTLYIVADHDENRTGFQAAHALAVRAIKAGIEAHIWQPETAGYDALDELTHRKSQP